MKIKTSRLEIIKGIITSSNISCQEDLLEALSGEGFALTQATLSRDLKQLKITKTLTDTGEYRYVLPFANYAKKSVSNRDQVISIDFSGQLAVVKTRPGYANGIASDIDQEVSDQILGTIAGDDTILLILREGVSKEDLLKNLSTFIKNIQ